MFSSPFPAVFSVSLEQQGYALYLGEYSTAQGLALLDLDMAVEVEEVGAADYNNLGWAQKDDFPAWKTVAEVLAFLQKHEDLDLISFEVRMGSDLALSTHDDGECHFWCSTKATLMALLEKTVPPELQPELIDKVLNQEGHYVCPAGEGIIKVYPYFEDYVNAVEGA